MDPSSISWTLPAPHSAARPHVADESAIAVALGRCGPLFLRSVLFVDAGAGLPAEAVSLARREGARVTALTAAPHARRALDAGAELVLDPERTDPAWYRGAWSVIVDPAARIGFRHAEPSLGPGGAYITASASTRDHLSAFVARLCGGPRLLNVS